MTVNNYGTDLSKQIALFYFAYRSIIEIPEEIVEAYQINRGHHRILFFIGSMPGLNVNELFHALEVSKQALHHPLRELKQRNYVVDMPDEKDKRSKRLFLTENGQQLFDELMAAQQAQFDTVFGQFDPQAKELWSHIMKGFAKDRPGLQYWDSI
ncbi:MarR family transcriptional regulator [Paenibacillus sp. BIHB 4019]|uniref:MarR family winged helix-turn-helix transcriptional regulator n=1 Tax=Paenibacillus sp. BIHB 4019 TaxID=1870819 RepID=UPI001F01174C|nr:MarR family transcriptional regulator [Paenibacillus sp. BIHB 4019]